MFADVLGRSQRSHDLHGWTTPVALTAVQMFYRPLSPESVGRRIFRLKVASTKWVNHPLVHKILCKVAHCSAKSYIVVLSQQK